MLSSSDLPTLVQSVRGMLSFFLAIGLWKVLDWIEKKFGRKVAMWLSIIIGCVAFLLLEAYNHAPITQ